MQIVTVDDYNKTEQRVDALGRGGYNIRKLGKALEKMNSGEGS